MIRRSLACQPAATAARRPGMAARLAGATKKHRDVGDGMLRLSKKTSVTFCATLLAEIAIGSAAEFGGEQQAFFNRHCSDCHDATAKEGGLDLAALSRDLSDSETLRRWVRIYDRVFGGEMPPKDAPQPDAAEKRAFLTSLKPGLVAADRTQRE